MHKFNRIRQVAPTCPYGMTRCRHLSNNIEPSVYTATMRLITGIIAHSATYRYLAYSEADFEIFHVAPMGGAKFGMEEGTEVPSPCQISPPSVQR